MIRDATTVTIVGRAGTNPQVSLGSTGDRVNFRVVSTDRRFDKVAGGWVDGDENWLTVVCWQGLAKAVMTTVRKGDPIVVIGRITTRRFEKNGVTQYFTDIRADLVGLDTARLGSRFVRSVADQPQAADGAAGNGPDAPSGVTGERSDEYRADADSESDPAVGSPANNWQDGVEPEPTPWVLPESPADDRHGALTSG